MAQGEEGGDEKVVPIRPEFAPSGRGPNDPGMEARVAKLEAAVEHLQSDVTDVKAALGRLEPKISEMFGAFPHLATKADLEKRPTAAMLAAIVAATAAIASMPIWTAWIAALSF